MSCAPRRRGRQRPRAGLVEHQHLVGLAEPAQRVEITPGGHPPPVNRVQLGRERRRLRLRVGDAGVELGGDVPVAGAAERHPLALARDDDAGRDRLHASGGQLRRDLLPQHGADLVAVEPVQDAAGLLRVHQIVVQVARVLSGGPDGRLGDLVEHHPLDWDARLEGLQQVPGDGLALAVAVCRQIQLVDVLEQVLQLGDGVLLVGADDVERFEVGIDIDAEARPRLGLVLGGHVRGGPGQVADVSPGGLDDVVGAQVASYFACLGRRLDNDEPPHASAITSSRKRLIAVAPGAAVPVSHLCLRSTSPVTTECRMYASALDPDPLATDNFAPRASRRKLTPPLQPIRCGATAQTLRRCLGVPPRSLPGAIAVVAR